MTNQKDSSRKILYAGVQKISKLSICVVIVVNGEWSKNDDEVTSQYFQYVPWSSFEATKGLPIFPVAILRSCNDI